MRRVLEEVFTLRAENPTYPLASGLIAQRPPSLASQYVQVPQQQLTSQENIMDLKKIRKGSFFKSKIELGKLVWILFSWAAGVPSQHMAWHLGVSPRTMVDWNNFVRDVCTEDTRRHLTQVGGLGGFDNAGQPIVVEIDESYFYGRKYHRGRIVHGLWVFGAVERESRRCMLQVVRNRRAQTLLPLIQQWCLPGTRDVRRLVAMTQHPVQEFAETPGASCQQRTAIWRTYLIYSYSTPGVL